MPCSWCMRCTCMPSISKKWVFQAHFSFLSFFVLISSWQGLHTMLLQQWNLNSCCNLYLYITMLLNSLFVDNYPVVLGSVKKQLLSKSKQLKDNTRWVQTSGIARNWWDSAGKHDGQGDPSIIRLCEGGSWERGKGKGKRGREIYIWKMKF